MKKKSRQSWRLRLTAFLLAVVMCQPLASLPFRMQTMAAANSQAKLKAPRSLTVKMNSANSVKLSWKKVSGASGYYVYRATSKNGSYQEIRRSNTKTQTSCVDDNGLKSGKTYYYKVRAYKHVGRMRILGSLSKAKSKKILGRPGTPKMKLSINKNKVLTISWNKVKRASHIEILGQDDGVFRRWAVASAKKRKVKWNLDGEDSGKIVIALRAYYIADGKKIYGKASNAMAISIP